MAACSISEESDKTLDTYHEKFMDRRVSRRCIVERFDVTQFDPLELERGQAIWRGRALDEYRSQVGLTEFLSEMTELGLPFGALGSGARVVRDEVRHVELCRRMLTVLGAGKMVPGEPQWVRSDKRLPVRMLNAARERTEETLAKAAMTCLVISSIPCRSTWGRWNRPWSTCRIRARRIPSATWIGRVRSRSSTNSCRRIVSNGSRPWACRADGHGGTAGSHLA
ncbi:MAG TPA: hypothetical protein VGO93_31420 [Candidatus Xenobia bacterium]|jgi:hypothetical protein